MMTTTFFMNTSGMCSGMMKGMCMSMGMRTEIMCDAWAKAIREPVFIIVIIQMNLNRWSCM